MQEESRELEYLMILIDSLGIKWNQDLNGDAYTYIKFFSIHFDESVRSQSVAFSCNIIQNFPAVVGWLDRVSI